MALDPRDGAVLAMASNPTYKPSVYVGRVDPKKLEPLIDRRSAKQRNYPGIDRAIAGVYPPGSTFKPRDGARRDLGASSSRRTSTSSARRRAERTALDKQVFKNWNPFMNAPMSLTTALSQSCDTYFYDVGNALLHAAHERKS